SSSPFSPPSPGGDGDPPRPLSRLRPRRRYPRDFRRPRICRWGVAVDEHRGVVVSLPLPSRLLLNQEQAAAYCGVSVNQFRAHVKVPPVKIGHSVRYDRRALDRWAARQNSSEPLSGDDWLERLDAGGESVRG